jgi:hypothetical protein
MGYFHPCSDLPRILKIPELGQENTCASSNSWVDLILDKGRGWEFVTTRTGSMATRLGFESGYLIAEAGHRQDCDDDLRQSIIQCTGNQFITGDIHEVVDAVLLWWRDGDGDLVDELVDGLTYLDVNGQIWVISPKAGRVGHVEPSDIQDAAHIAGLSQTSTLSIASDWSATRLVARKSSRR